MLENGTQRGTTMGKVQKSLMLPEELHRIVQTLEDKQGASFTRIMTAALLQYLFHRYIQEESSPGGGPEQGWMKLAIFVERGTYTVREIPEFLITNNIVSAEAMVSFHEKDSAEAKAERQRQRVKTFKEMKRSWDNAVEQCGDKIEAIIGFLDA